RRIFAPMLPLESMTMPTEIGSGCGCWAAATPHRTARAAKERRGMGTEYQGLRICGASQSWTWLSPFKVEGFARKAYSPKIGRGGGARSRIRCLKDSDPGQLHDTPITGAVYGN